MLLDSRRDGVSAGTRWNTGTPESVRGDWIRTGDPCAQAAPFAILCDVLQAAIVVQLLELKPIVAQIAARRSRQPIADGTRTEPVSAPLWAPAAPDPLRVKQALLPA